MKRGELFMQPPWLVRYLGILAIRNPAVKRPSWQPGGSSIDVDIYNVLMHSANGQPKPALVKGPFAGSDFYAVSRQVERPRPTTPRGKRNCLLLQTG